MDYDVSIDHENKIVVTLCTGILDISSAASMTRDVRKQAFELGYGLLYDMTKVSVAATFAEAYAFPRDLQRSYEEVKHRFGKAAIFYTSGRDEDFWKFYENTARNTGSVIKIFVDKAEAVQWLSEKAAE